MAQITLTRRIANELNKYLLEKIISILRKKENEKNIDYLQIFEVKGDELINSQEVPEIKKSYKLVYKFKENIKIWAVESIDKELGRCWTILFPEEY